MSKTSKEQLLTNFKGQYTQYRDDCKDLYINKRWQPSEIMQKYPDLSREALTHWIKKGEWVAAREAIIKSETEEIVLRRKHSLTTLLGDSIEAISNTVKKYVKIGMTMEEAKDLSTVITNMDKLARLADGKPTDVIENRNLNMNIPTKAMATKADIENAIKIVQDDPFTNEGEENEK